MANATPHTLRAKRTLPAAKIISFIVLLILCVIWLFPLVYMLGTSFKDEVDILTNPTGIFPRPGHWTLENYTGFIIRDGRIDNMPIWMMNSFLIAFFKVALTLILDCLAAYAFVFLRFKGRVPIYHFLMMSMAIPAVVATTAMFSMYASSVRALDAVDSKAFTYLWLIIPGLSSVFNMLLMRNFFASIPKDIVESARMDGSSNLRIFRTIVLPLARSTILLIVLFTFTGAWNDLFWPQLLLSGKAESWLTVTAALANHSQGNSVANLGVNMATAAFSLIPIMIVFLVAQDKMIDGMVTTGVKS